MAINRCRLLRQALSDYQCQVPRVESSETILRGRVLTLRQRSLGLGATAAPATPPVACGLVALATSTGVPTLSAKLMRGGSSCSPAKPGGEAGSLGDGSLRVRALSGQRRPWWLLLVLSCFYACHDALRVTSVVPGRWAVRPCLTSVRALEREADEGAGEPQAPNLSAEEVAVLFPELSERQWKQVRALTLLLTKWNDRVNLISRKDIGNALERHVVPCLAVAKMLDLQHGAEVLDVGTGGGLPGLPLAICFPNASFTLIDARAKKIAAVQDMASRLGLTNVRALHIRAEEVTERFDYIIGRAVTGLPKFVGWVEGNLRTDEQAARAQGLHHPRRAGRLARGILYMRGEASREELEELGAQPASVVPVEDVLQGAAVAEGWMRDRGYSSLMHFTAEDILVRVPLGR